MKRFSLLILVFYIFISQAYTQTATEGYYKDIFMDGGVKLYNKTEIPAAEALGLSYEYIATEQTTRQNDRMLGGDTDYNGVLLYPDGEPRFRLIHTNGGYASQHGSSLGEEGRERVREFFNNGGSYTGICAGAFIASVHYKESGENASYYHIWPGRTHTSGLLDIYTGHFIEPDSPLLNYYDFGNDLYIENVYHNGGAWAREEVDFPEQTEILLRFDNPGEDMHNKVSCWAYKKNDESGRLVVIGSHPENVTSGERLDLMKSIFQYALDGQGDIQIKGILENGVARTMDKNTADNDPEYTKIGDKQYHHFKIEIPEDNQQLVINLYGQSGYHFNLYLNKDDFAFRSNALYLDTTESSSKTLNISNLDAGTYYVSVECETTTEIIQLNWGFEYINNLDVLNGLSYMIQADYSPSSVDENLLSGNFSVYPNPASEFINIRNSSDIDFIQILDIGGKILREFETDIHSDFQQIDLSALSPGVYFIKAKNKNGSVTKKIFKI